MIVRRPVFHFRPIGVDTFFYVEAQENGYDMKDIRSFSGRYKFLSNFYPCFVYYDGQRYSSVERAFQAAKVLDKNERKPFILARSEAEAKYWGRKVNLRDDWESVKVGIMKDLVRQKFSKEPLRSKLLETGDCYIEEGNNHGDRFWGTVKGQGKNILGKILMQVREDIRNETND